MKSSVLEKRGQRWRREIAVEGEDWGFGKSGKFGRDLSWFKYSERDKNPLRELYEHNAGSVHIF